MTCNLEALIDHGNFTETEFGKIEFRFDGRTLTLIPATPPGWFIEITDTYIPIACTVAEVFAICRALIQGEIRFDVHCTYCWQRHFVKIDTWLQTRRFECGQDSNRYFFNKKDYLNYVRTYQANGYQHHKDQHQMRLF